MGQYKSRKQAGCCPAGGWAETVERDCAWPGSDFGSVCKSVITGHSPVNPLRTRFPHSWGNAMLHKFYLNKAVKSTCEHWVMWMSFITSDIQVKVVGLCLR